MMNHDVNEVSNGAAMYESLVDEESRESASSTQLISGLQQIGGLFDIKPFQGIKESTEATTPYEGYSIDSNYIKKAICNQSNKTKIRPVLLSFSGIPESGKTRAVSYLLDNYVDSSPFVPMTKKNEMKLGADGITYYELVAAGFHPLRELTITEVTKESSCAFGILSAFKEELLVNGLVPLFNFNAEESTCIFGDPELDDHLCHTFNYLSQREHTPTGSVVTYNEQQYARRLKKLLPEGIALINIWDIAINRIVLHFMTSLRGLLYNNHTWLFLDIERDLQNLEKPPEIPEGNCGGTFSRDGSVLMKWRPRIHYLLRFSRMSESKYGPRKGVCTIFAKYTSTCKNLEQKVVELEDKIKQTAKHIGVSSLIEPQIVPVNFNSSHDIHDDQSLHLYQKFQQVIYQTPYEDVPLSWVFLRSLFFRLQKKFILKSELREKAKRCGMDEDSLTKFCQFYMSFGSIFDLSLVNPDYHYVIVKPMEFLKSLDKFLCPDDSTCQQYPKLVNGIIPEKAFKEVFKDDWSAFVEALLSTNLATKVPSSQLDIPDLDPDDTYYFIPLSRKGDLVMKADSTAVHLITSINTPHVFKQATFAKYLLQLLPESKLVPCSNINQTIIKECSTSTTITLVSHSPATKIAVNQASPEICSLIVKTYNEIAETCKVGTTKYKFVTICSKSGVPDVRDIPSCQYHVLPNDTLCDECKNDLRINDQLKAWNEALREHPVPLKSIPDKKVKITELAYIAEQIASCDPTVVAKTLGFQDLTPFQETERERLINEMLLVWSRGDQSHIEPRQELARKLLELDMKYIGVPEQKPDFKALAQELDIHVRSTNPVN